LNVLLEVGAVEAVRDALSSDNEDERVWHAAAKFFFYLIDESASSSCVRKNTPAKILSKKELAAVRRNAAVVGRNVPLCFPHSQPPIVTATAALAAASELSENCRTWWWVKMNPILEAASLQLRPWEPAIHSHTPWGISFRGQVVAVLLCQQLARKGEAFEKIPMELIIDVFAVLDLVQARVLAL